MLLLGGSKVPKYVNLCFSRKAIQWQIYEKAKKEVERILRRFPLKIKVNTIYLYDEKNSTKKLPGTMRAILQRGAVSALYEPKTKSLVLNAYEVIGDEFDIIHELAHAFDHQHNMISHRRDFVEAFVEDRKSWHEDPFISGRRFNKPHEFFADFVAVLVTEGKREAKSRYPAYYKIFRKYFSI